MLTVFLLLALGAFICAIAEACGKCPGWVPVILLCILELLRCLPLGK